MGVITVKHYKASDLPEELRRGLPSDALVSVTVEEETKPSASNLETLKAQIDAARRMATRRTSPTEAVERVRELREEWDH